MSEARQMLILMLAARGSGKTLCPSEVARAIAGPDGDWRAAMPAVHAAVDWMVSTGGAALSWKGAALAARDGPYRIGRGT